MKHRISAGLHWLLLARRGRAARFARAAAGQPTDLDDRMMNRAIALAEQAAARGEVPIGAVVYGSPGTADEGRIYAEAFNRREELRDPSQHAEFTAIVGAARQLGDWRLNHCSLAVTLEPCPMCAGLIINARVGRVIYGADDPKAGAVRSLYALLGDRRLNHRPVVIPHVREEPCSRLLSSFFARLRERRRERSGNA
ncbi:MAG: nucleoside deaminase [Phycisphaerales bacterium]|nr:nucleoside deaminase [Phycisphaerales bacterium]